MKKTILLLSLLVFVINVYSQENSMVTIVTIGQGQNIENAKLLALRSAIEQTYGAFVSSETQIINGDLLKDDINTITKGNVENFEIISQEQLKDQSWVVTIKSIVSLKKLEGYCKSKGNEVVIDGQSFAFAAKLAKLNQKSEIKAIENLLVAMDKMLETAFDYKLEVNGPLVSGNEYMIGFIVKAYTNKNWENTINFFFTTLNSIVLSENEKNNYERLGYQTYPSPTILPSLGGDNYWLDGPTRFNYLLYHGPKFNLRTKEVFLLLYKYFENITDKVKLNKITGKVEDYEDELLYKRFFVDDGIKKIQASTFKKPSRSCEVEGRRVDSDEVYMIRRSHNMFWDSYSHHICPRPNQFIICFEHKAYYKSDELEKLKKITIEPLK